MQIKIVEEMVLNYRRVTVRELSDAARIYERSFFTWGTVCEDRRVRGEGLILFSTFACTEHCPEQIV
jgi:hypothetical protein